jgi:hypothetical protein
VTSGLIWSIELQLILGEKVIECFKTQEAIHWAFGVAIPAYVGNRPGIVSWMIYVFILDGTGNLKPTNS